MLETLIFITNIFFLLRNANLINNDLKMSKSVLCGVDID